MFSGGDSSDGVNSLNPLGAYGFVNQVAVSKAVAAGQNIDWAQLAQQWIQMRDNTELERKTDPNIGDNKVADSSCNNFKFEEKGEADMDMDDEEQTEEKTSQRLSNDFATASSSQHNFNQSWFFGENDSQIASRSNVNNQWNSWTNQEILTQPLPNQNTVSNGPTNPTAHIPSLLKINVPHPNEIRVMPDIPNQTDNTYMMDAAKRKGLPAWIREGLEKMEREKQKQLEKEQKNSDIKSPNEPNFANKNNYSNTVSSINGIPPAILDDDSTDNEETIPISSTIHTDVNLKKDNEAEETDDAHSFLEAKTYEQKLADLMIAVRKTLTELLLEATNEEISKVADETIKIFKSKASSAQVVRKSALSTLTGRLGLAAYGDSSSETDSDNDDPNSSKKTTGQSESDNDSEEEIKNVIRLKRRGFTKIAEEIEDRVAVAAAREEEKLKYFLRKEEEEEKEYNRKKQERALARDPATFGHSGHNTFKGYEKDFGEITETKIQHLNGKRQKERSSRRERITRFSDNKDKYVSIANSASFLANVNSAKNTGTTSASLATNNQRQNIPDINGLLPNYTNMGMANALNAADAALEKALKGKTSTSPEKERRRHERDRSYSQSTKRRRVNESKKSRSCSKSSTSTTSSSSSSSSSSNSDSSSTSASSSHHSKKYKHRSAKKQKSHTSTGRQYVKSHKSYRDDRKYSSVSYKKRDRESKSSRNRRSASSDSDDEYRRRHRNNSNHSRKTSRTRSYTSSRRDPDRDHSRSQSRSSYSSNNRRQ